MIVRTYGRRNRSLNGGYSGGSEYDGTESDGFGEPFSQESPQDIYSFDFSSQDSHWAFDSEPFGGNSSQEVRELEILPARKHRVGVDSADVPQKLKKARNGKMDLELPRKGKSKGAKPVPVVMAPALAGTATLMETQEFGEMMEHVDEVNFALDGLRKAQPHRIRRASLLTLLSICATAQQRRLLRTHGMAKSIIDAVLGLSFDDSPSNLAAAALFYILTSDGQDDNLLDSPTCIRFLIRLLKPLTTDISKNRSISSKLLSLRKDMNALKDSGNGLDSTSNAIMLKVQEILVSCKEMKSTDGDDAAISKKPELNPKWIALLTMEKACLTTISLEDASGTVRRTGGNFKEKLRELGGLNAVFEVAQNCHSIMERWLEQSEVSSKDKMGVESLLLILKCLKVMENATFLSNDNQCHLLEMEGTRDRQGSPRSFTSLILSLIKILSGLFLSYKSSSCNSGEEVCDLSAGTDHANDTALLADRKVDRDDIISISSTEYSSREGTSSQKSFSISRNSQWLTPSVSGISKSTPETSTSHAPNVGFSQLRANSSTSESCSGTSRISCGTNIKSNASRMTSGPGRRGYVAEDTVDLTEDSEDPFAFHEDEFEPSKWDVLSGKPRVREIVNISALTIDLDIDESCRSQPTLSQQGSCNPEKNQVADVTRSFDEETSNLLGDCLLSAVKALMNLTNDNPVGCRQIASCGGLEILSSLIAGHFPSFSKSVLEVDLLNDRNLSDQELDLLVAILGLLVNLVEKDGQNRSRLARANVPLQSVKGAEEEGHRDVISLLCSVFLANQGAGEAAEEGKVLTWDDEAAVLQGEKEAEKMIVEAYSALLLAFLSTESMRTRNAIAGYLPDHNMKVLVPVLERFVEFHMTLNMISAETHSTVLEVIESCRMP